MKTADGLDSASQAIAGTKEAEEHQTVVSGHYKDWPNAAGFNASQEQREPIELSVTGHFPEYASGVLYRTGPGSYRVPTSTNGEFSLDHWFDGWTHVHRFQIETAKGPSTTIRYNSRCQVDKLIEKVRKTGKLDGVTFGNKRDPCEGFFQKLKQTFVAANDSPTKRIVGEQNVGVTISRDPAGYSHQARDKKNKNILVTATDANQYCVIEPDTLKPMELTTQASLHPSLKGPLAAAHSAVDPVTGDRFNYNLDFGPKEVYRVFKISAATGKVEILAKISGNGNRAAYMHSLFLTEDFVVLCIWPAFFTAKGTSILWERNILDALSFDKSAECRWLVIDRKQNRGLVSTFTSKSMFSFHSVNAWQVNENDGTHSITCELVQYQNMDILEKLYYKNLVSNEPGSEKWGKRLNDIAPNLTRYCLRGVPQAGTRAGTRPAEVVFKFDDTQGGDLPVINPLFATKPHRYVYSVLGSGESSFVEKICKTDTLNKSATYWEVSKHTPGEPIFVANPDGEDEDDGILLSVVLDGIKGTSYLICLDAKNLTELGRADVNQPVGFGFHGAHYGA